MLMIFVIINYFSGTLFDLLKTPTQNVLSNVSKEGYDGNTKKQLTKKKKRKKDIKNDSSVKIERHLESTVIRDCSVLLRRIHPSYLRNTYINLQKISEKKLFKSVGIRKRSIVKVYNRQRKGKPNHSNESNPAKKFNITKTIDDCISPVKKPRKRRRKTVSRSPNKKLKPANSSISISTDASDINTSKTTCCTTEQSINRNNGNMGASGEISQSYADLEHNVEASCKETCPDVILL